MKRKSIIIMLIAVFTLSITVPEDMYSVPPPWAPAHGYRSHKGYVYFPEPNIYYDIRRNGYFFFNGGNWQFGIELPLLYSNFDLVNARKIMFQKNWDKPYIYNDYHIRKYKERHEDNDGPKYRGAFDDEHNNHGKKGGRDRHHGGRK